MNFLEAKNKLNDIILSLPKEIKGVSEVDLSIKPNTDKWSKKEILGHLIDSGINNLKRFTEIPLSNNTYQVIRYDQVNLVITNQYQESILQDIVDLWANLNKRILVIMNIQDQATLKTEIILPDGEDANLEFIMIDYVKHLEHHVDQILN